MATRYKVVKDPGQVPRLARMIIKAFPKELGHIDLDEVQFAWRIGEKSHYHGMTRRITGVNKMFTDKKIVIIIFMRSWKGHTASWRGLLLYHELKHILPKDKKGEYKLVRHDVEDFGEMIEQFGVAWGNKVSVAKWWKRVNKMAA